MASEERLYVMIVEHDPLQSKIALRNLQEKFPDVEFVAARNGGEAFMMMQSRAPHLTITDLQMPGLNGFALLRKIRANSETKDVPVMVLGSVRDLESVRLAVSLGADDFIAKPVDFHVLADRINQLVSKKKKGIPLRENHRAYKRREIEQPVEVQMVVVGIHAERFAVLAPGEVTTAVTTRVNVNELCKALRIPIRREPIDCAFGGCREVKGGFMVDLLPFDFPDGYQERAERLSEVEGAASRVLGNPQKPVMVGLSCASKDLSGGGIQMESPWPFPESAGLRVSLRNLLNAIHIHTLASWVTCIVRHSPREERPYRCGLQFTDLDPELQTQVMRWCVSDEPSLLALSAKG